MLELGLSLVNQGCLYDRHSSLTVNVCWTIMIDAAVVTSVVTQNAGRIDCELFPLMFKFE